jgi:hypothetical protein
VSSDTWFETLSPERIDNHGRNHPDHEVGFLPGDDVVVFDADSPESLAALLELEEKLGLAASLIVATPRGEDHYFRRAPGTIARGDCRRTDEHPERIDVKAGQSLVVLPPSTANRWKRNSNDQASSLAEAPQAFIDAVFDHNGRDAPRPSVAQGSSAQTAIERTIDNPLLAYSMRGMSEQLADKYAEEVPFLGSIVLMFQSTVIYAAPNTGKTLLVLSMLIDAIRPGSIDPETVFYVNVDDTPHGLMEKVKIAEDFGFHMLAEGYNDFHADELLDVLVELVVNDRAKGVVVILDTLKKFTDLMDKRTCTRFTNVIRQFVMRGGTCLSLAHTNKYRNRAGRPIYAGTTDVIDDSDCVYLMYEAAIDADAELETVVFENIKARGNVARRVAYRYSVAHGLSYREILDSVERVDDMGTPSLHQDVPLAGCDARVIETIVECIGEGIDTKMSLAETAAKRSGVSRRTALRIIENYSGSNPEVHRWNFAVGDRGAKKFQLLDSITAATDPTV